MKTSLRILILFFLLLSLISQVSAETGTISDPVGFHRFIFRHGWNFISLPFMPEVATLQNTFNSQLTAGETADQSDRIYSFDHSTGEWSDAWFDLNFLWVGSLAEDTLSPAQTFWVYILPTSPDSQEVIIKGNAIDQESFDMGLFPEGSHFIGNAWAADINLATSNLSTSGWQSSAGVLNVNPENNEYLYSDMILTYLPSSGWTKVAWFDGNVWRGNMQSIVAGGAYMMMINDQLNWNNFPRPGTQTTIATISNKIWIPLEGDKSLEAPDIPGLDKLKKPQNTGRKSKKTDRRIVQ